MEQHPEIHIADAGEHYSIDVFNRCEQGYEVLHECFEAYYSSAYNQ